jgi:hypothetical protein
MTTRRVADPMEIRDLYGLRPSVEVGWRQTKCYWDLTGFRSCNVSLVVNQVIFVLLAYTLLQVFLVKSERGELAKATRQRLLAELLPDGEKIAVYFENRVAYFSVAEYTDIILNLADGARPYFSVAEYTDIILNLADGARRRLQGTVRRLRKSHIEPPALGPRPT